MMARYLRRQPESSLVDLLIIVIILTTGLKFTFGLENGLDIFLYDESNYLYSGVRLKDFGLPAAPWAPLYAVWYFILSQFQPDRIALYYLNYKLMAILPPVFLYILLRRNKVSILVSFVLAWLLLLSRLNGTWPRVSHFALIVTLLIFMFLSYIRSLLWASALASLGALLVSYIRPEYFSAYVLLSLIFITLVVLEYRKQRKFHLASLVMHALVSISLIGMIGLPVFGERSFIAFGQHFAGRWVHQTGVDINPWTNTDAIVFQNFGSARSIWEAFANNPYAFIKHVAYNILKLIGYSPLLATPIILDLPSNKIFIGFTSILFVALCAAYIFKNKSVLQKNFLDKRTLLMLFALFLLPGIIAAIIIYPRDHYLMIPYVLVVVSVAILTRARIPQGTIESYLISTSYKKLFLLSLFMIALTPSPYFDSGDRMNVDTIRFIQSLRIEESVNMLEAEGGYHVYLGNNFRRVAEYEKNMNFDRFVHERNINMIVVSSTLLKDTRFRDDVEWHDFLARYSTYGFVRMDIPRTDSKLFLRTDLLQK